YNIALIYKQMGNMKLFEENLKKAISYNNYFIPAYISLGEYYLEQKRYGEALKIYLTAKEKGISNPRIYLGLGKTYYHIGEYDKAKEYLLKAKKLARNDDFLLLEVDRMLKLVDKKLVEIAEKEAERERKARTVQEEITPLLPAETVQAGELEGTESVEEIEPLHPAEIEVAKKEEPEEILERKKVKPKIRFYVLAGRFTQKEKALQVLEKLKNEGIEGELKKEFVDGKPVYSVIIGYFDGYREASKFYRKKLRPLGIRGIVKFTQK
ncbi:MAG: tetratricopeptide repeat protein, partial [Aquificae bacterium]|nr:tetratricopeptide repeat protein [Aquificota bacterium]